MGNENQNKAEPDLNQILKNKREKLANLQAAQTTEALEAKLESLQNELAKEKANTPK